MPDTGKSQVILGKMTKNRATYFVLKVEQFGDFIRLFESFGRLLRIMEIVRYNKLTREHR